LLDFLPVAPCGAYALRLLRSAHVGPSTGNQEVCRLMIQTAPNQEADFKCAADNITLINAVTGDSINDWLTAEGHNQNAGIYVKIYYNQAPDILNTGDMTGSGGYSNRIRHTSTTENYVFGPYNRLIAHHWSAYYGGWMINPTNTLPTTNNAWFFAVQHNPGPPNTDSSVSLNANHNSYYTGRITASSPAAHSANVGVTTLYKNKILVAPQITADDLHVAYNIDDPHQQTLNIDTSIPQFNLIRWHGYGTSGGNGLNGAGFNCAELIVYDVDASGVKLGIENNQMEYYGI